MTASTWRRRRHSPRKLTRLVQALSLLAALCALHPSKALTEGRFWLDNATGLAIGGFDPVSYFTGTTPLHGTAEYEYVWRGVAWRFANEGNLAAFQRDPEIYAPQFGGHGPLALARGHRSAGNPRIWLVNDGKLYLFYSTANRSEWQSMPLAYLEDAVAEWQRIVKRKQVSLRD